jgi:hypothetical protein
VGFVVPEPSRPLRDCFCLWVFDVMLVGRVAEFGAADSVRHFATILRDIGGEVVHEPLGPDTPHVLVQQPHDHKFAPLIDHMRARLRDSLEIKVDRDQIVLLPFIFSSAGREKLEKEIPRDYRAKGADIERVESGAFEELDAGMFSSLSGKTVILIGHIVRRDDGLAFEIRRPDGGRPTVKPWRRSRGRAPPRPRPAHRPMGGDHATPLTRQRRTPRRWPGILGGGSRRRTLGTRSPTGDFRLANGTVTGPTRRGSETVSM